MDLNHRFYKTTKGGFLKLFSTHKKAIEDYFKAENLDLENEEHLKKILQFCSELPQ